jgi:hypothetical protein
MVAQALLPAAVAIVGEYLPHLVGRLTGDRGEVIAREVVQVAATVAGTRPDADPREILAGLRKDPERQAELRLKLAEIELRSYEAQGADRASARTYQAQVGPQGWRRGNIMLISVGVGLVATVAAVFFLPSIAGQPTDTGTLALLTTIAGALLKMFSDAFAFEFGSSAGSKEKTEQIQRVQQALIDSNRVQAEKLTAPPAAPAPAPPPAARTASGQPGDAVVTDGTVVAVDDATVIDATDPDSGVPRERDFVAELRRMAGTA